MSVAFVGSTTCSPLPNSPCTLTVAATALDREGGPLTYRWSGCAAGTAPQSSCLVHRPGEVVTAVLDVIDEGGLSARAEAHGRGINQPPQFGISYTWVSPGGGAVEFLGWVRDPDEGYLWGQQYCIAAAASGACTRASLQCPNSGPVLMLLRAAPEGTCEIAVDVKDSWDQVGTWVVSFDINHPAAFSITPKRD